MRYLAPFAFGIVLVLGCSDGHQSDPNVEVLDSLGVRLFIHSDSPGQLMELSEPPQVVVGLAEGTEMYRVRGGVLLPDFGFVIANSGADEILFFGSAGRLSRRVGGEGEGPEEFKNVLWIQGRGEGHVTAYDAGNLRMNTYDESGDMIASSPVRLEAEAPPSDNALMDRGPHLGLTSEDRLITVPWAVAQLDGVEGVLPLIGELRVYSEDLTAFALLDTVQLRTWYEARQPEGPPIEMVFDAPIFLFSANGSRLVYSEADRHRLLVLEDGELSQVIVEARPRVPFSADSIPPYMNHHADSLPAYRALQMDSDGRIWAQPAIAPGATIVRWRVFSTDGRSKQEIDLPLSSLVLDARGDLLLLLERDSLDVETVALRAVNQAF